MKWLLWAGVALLALMWTGLVAVAAQLSDWLASTVASGETVALVRGAVQWPGWLLWLDPAWLEAMRQAWTDVLAWVTAILPTSAGWAGTMLGWVAPLLWVVWAVVLGLMLMLAGGVHWWLARRGPGVAT